MKLALVTETFPPEINGVSMTLGRLVDGLRARGIEVMLIAPSRKDRPVLDDHDYLPVPGAPIPRYPELRFGFPAHARLRRAWQAPHRPDVIHIATEGPLGWSALRVAAQMGIPCVSSFHTNFHSYGKHYGYGFLNRAVLGWLRSCHNRTKRTFVPSDDLMQTLQADGFENLRILARGVDTALFGPHRRSDELRKQWGVGPHDPVALYVGRLAGEKNLGLVIEGYHAMRARLPAIKLVLVGDGPERERIRKLVPDSQFCGMRTGVELAAHYASADCFLFASVTETFGNVVTEAMASALAVVAFDYAAPGRFIAHSRNGFLAKFGDQQAFIAACNELAACRDQWQGIGASARSTMLPHSWDAIVDGYLAEIQTLQLNAAQPRS